MKSISFQKRSIWMRTGIPVLFVAVISLFLLSFTVPSRLTTDIWQQLGISQQAGTEKIKTSFLNNYFDHYGVRNAKNIVTGNRAAIAKDLLAYTKQYLSSTAFKNEYERLRAQAKPTEPTGTVKSKEDVRKEKINETLKSIKDIEESMKTMSADMKKIMQPGLDYQKSNLKDYQDPNSQLIELFYQGEQMNRDNDIRYYKENMQYWETNYPADYKDLIKARLQKYLSIASTVDFGAELTERNGKKYFAKTEYERKNNDWKMIYRAGKEVYEVTKAFAEGWLKEL